MKHLAFSICLLIFITLPLTATAQVVTIPDPNLRAVIEAALGKAPDEPITTADMARLTELHANGSNISDLTGIEHATNLGTLFLVNNNISDISSLAGLTDLSGLFLVNNNISDISSLAGLTDLSLLHLGINNISDISSLAGLTDLSGLFLVNNNISDISPLAGLTDLTWLQLGYNNISDLSPLVANTGLGSGDAVYVDGNPLSYPSINTHIPTLQSRGVEVSADNLKPPTLEYLLSVPAGDSLIHIPLKVSAVNGVAKTIESISDLYDALGGAEAVNSLTVQTSRGFQNYRNVSDRGTAQDGALTDATGIMANMKVSTSVRLTGKPLGNNGSSSISLNPGANLVGLPLRDSRINRVSDLLSLDGIASVLILDDGGYQVVARAGAPNDIAITGGQGFILTAQQATTVTLSGEGWTNVTAPAAAPKLLTGLLVTNTTPVLALKGEIVDEVSAVNPVGFRVAVKNFSTGRQVTATAADAEVGYRLTVVDIETMRAAGVGDVLEISAQSTNPFIGVKPLRYTVTVEDVLHGWIQLPALVAYEIPKETELLANYPNPFNPETWIPYRLAEDAFVTLTIYDTVGQVVRTLDVGHRVAAVYENRSKAIYWDGRNAVGESVASGVYFYHLSAGDYFATRRMVILK